MSRPATFALLLFAAVPALAADAPSRINHHGVPADFDARPAPTTDRSATWRLTNSPQALEARFGTGGVLVGPHDGRAPGWIWELALIDAGPVGAVTPVAPAEPMALGNRVEFHHPGLIEWYVNDPRGLEHGFTILEPPARNPTQLELLLAITGSLSPSINADADGLLLRDDSWATVLTYAGLHAFDATDRTLSAWMELSETGGGERLLRIVVDAAGAVFPVLIDPLIATQVKQLTAADPDIGDRFGAAVSVDGDTAVVGAWRDGGATQAVGSAYVFMRNAGGTDNWGQVKRLIPPDAASGDFFGRSVSIDGDTVVVGADEDDAAVLDSGSAYVFGLSVSSICGDGVQETPEACDDGNDEGSYGVDSTLAPRPEAVGVGACDRPAGPPTCGN